MFFFLKICERIMGTVLDSFIARSHGGKEESNNLMNLERCLKALEFDPVSKQIIPAANKKRLLHL
jgi:hypothetical protein